MLVIYNQFVLFEDYILYFG